MFKVFRVSHTFLSCCRFEKRSMCVSKRETYMQKIQELGSLPPPSELEKFSGKTISDLMKALESVNKKLKKYSHVNKKAYDQYVNFSEQRESLLKRKEELDQGAEKVKELVESLDRQKDEAINRTFRGVSAHFKDVFKELVPLGSGELIMRTAIDDMLGAEDGEEESVASEDSDSQPKKKKAIDPSNPDVSLYRGVGIKVQFSAAGENFMMSQLSGGQKALVALALIFAIQRCDPAPFYLFDELDQALDSTYRAAVANLIQRQANCDDNPTQFIVSTFRPELVAVANRCYGISHQNKVSSLHPLSKKDALHFIANVMNEEEAVGDVTSLAPSKATRQSLESRKRKVRSIVETDDEGDDDDDDDNKDAEADDMTEDPIASPIASETSP
jgi:structural maintenance of chromosome 3 (chondroitin sulfate proteoglycan 6)